MAVYPSPGPVKPILDSMSASFVVFWFSESPKIRNKLPIEFFLIVRSMMGKGQKVALLAIGVNLLLFGLKYLFGGLSGSIALQAEAFHSLSDVIASSTDWRSLKLA
jgi:Co/Zn/Cd efflux system component